MARKILIRAGIAVVAAAALADILIAWFLYQVWQLQLHGIPTFNLPIRGFP